MPTVPVRGHVELRADFILSLNLGRQGDQPSRAVNYVRASASPRGTRLEQSLRSAEMVYRVGCGAKLGFTQNGDMRENIARVKSHARLIPRPLAVISKPWLTLPVTLTVYWTRTPGRALINVVPVRAPLFRETMVFL